MNPVQFSSSNPSIPAIKVNNFYIGTVGAYGPSPITNFYAGIENPPPKDFTIYKSNGSNELFLLTFDGPSGADFEGDITPYLKNLGYITGENNQFGRALSTASQQDDICITNKDLEPIYPGSQSGRLSFYLDGGFTPCFASGSDTTIVQGNNQFTGTLTGTSSPCRYHTKI